MFRCHVCGKTEGQEKLVSEVFDIDGKSVRVEQIPTVVCVHCGEPVFSRETTEKVRRQGIGVDKELGSENNFFILRRTVR